MIKRESASRRVDGTEEDSRTERGEEEVCQVERGDGDNTEGRVRFGAAVSLPRSYSPFYTDFTVLSSS